MRMSRFSFVGACGLLTGACSGSGHGPDPVPFDLVLLVSNPHPDYVVYADEDAVPEDSEGFYRWVATYDDYATALDANGVRLTVRRNDEEVSELVVRVRTCSEICADSACSELGTLEFEVREVAVDTNGIIALATLACFECQGTAANLQACP